MTTIDRTTTYVAAFGVLLSALAFVASVHAGVGALVGAVIALLDWVALRFLGQRMLASQGGGRTMLSLALIAKMGLVLGVCAAVLMTRRIDPIGFLVGISALAAGVLVGSFHQALSAPASAVAAAPSESE